MKQEIQYDAVRSTRVCNRLCTHTFSMKTQLLHLQFVEIGLFELNWGSKEPRRSSLISDIREGRLKGREHFRERCLITISNYESLSLLYPVFCRIDMQFFESNTRFGTVFVANHIKLICKLVSLKRWRACGILWLWALAGGTL